MLLNFQIMLVVVIGTYLIDNPLLYFSPSFKLAYPSITNYLLYICMLLHGPGRGLTINCVWIWRHHRYGVRSHIKMNKVRNNPGMMYSGIKTASDLVRLPWDCLCLSDWRAYLRNRPWPQISIFERIKSAMPWAHPIYGTVFWNLQRPSLTKRKSVELPMNTKETQVSWSTTIWLQRFHCPVRSMYHISFAQFAASTVVPRCIACTWLRFKPSVELNKSYSLHKNFCRHEQIHSFDRKFRNSEATSHLEKYFSGYSGNKNNHSE